MSTAKGTQPDRPPAEADEQRRSRLAREAKLIEEARRQAARGEVVDLDAIERWIESWDTPDERPKPTPRPPQ